MKVLILITRGDSIGGAQLYVRALAERLQQERHEVLVVTGTTGMLTSMLAESGVSTTVCGSLRRALHPFHDLRAIREVGRIIRAFEPDLVSAHSSKAGVVGRIASRLNDVPCVFTAHGWAFADGIAQPGRTVWQLIEWLAEPLAARIVCVSTADRNLALRRGFDAARLVTIHNGIQEAPAPQRALRAPGSPPRIVMVARCFAQKDHTSLLQAIRTIPGCELDLVGDGPLEDAVKDYASSLGIRERVHFHGYRPDVGTVLAGADLFVLASHYEGFPLTTLEAMRAGLPVVVSDVGGAGEAVTDGVTGYLVPGGDVPLLRDRIRTLIEQPSLRIAMGEAGRASYLRSFTFDRMYRDTLALYEGVVARSRSREVVHVATGGQQTTVRSLASAWRSVVHLLRLTVIREPLSRRSRRVSGRSVWD